MPKFCQQDLCFRLFDTFFCVVMQFRAAIQLQFDFHRAIYNLGTVLVALPSNYDNVLYWSIDFVGNCEIELDPVLFPTFVVWTS